MQLLLAYNHAYRSQVKLGTISTCTNKQPSMQGLQYKLNQTKGKGRKYYNSYSLISHLGTAEFVQNLWQLQQKHSSSTMSLMLSV